MSSLWKRATHSPWVDCIFSMYNIYFQSKLFPVLLLSPGFWFLIVTVPGHCLLFEPRHEKTNILVSDQVRHKPGCTATEDD